MYGALHRSSLRTHFPRRRPDVIADGAGLKMMADRVDSIGAAPKRIGPRLWPRPGSVRVASFINCFTFQSTVRSAKLWPRRVRLLQFSQEPKLLTKTPRQTLVRPIGGNLRRRCAAHNLLHLRTLRVKSRIVAIAALSSN